VIDITGYNSKERCSFFSVSFFKCIFMYNGDVDFTGLNVVLLLIVGLL